MQCVFEQILDCFLKIFSIRMETFLTYCNYNYSCFNFYWLYIFKQCYILYFLYHCTNYLSQPLGCDVTFEINYSTIQLKFGEQGWRSGESARPGSIPGPGVMCGLSLLLVLFSAPRGFSPGTPVFPSPQKPTFPNSNSILECTDISERVLVNSLVLRG